jgi:hypothetical protein
MIRPIDFRFSPGLSPKTCRKLRSEILKRILIACLHLPFLALCFFSCGTKQEENRAVIQLLPVKIGEDYQYISKEGRIEINPLFSEACLFRGGLALVKAGGNNGRWGYISESGKFTLTAKYVSASAFSEGLAWVVEENEGPKAVNVAGELRINLPSASRVRIFREGLAAFCLTENGKNLWGFIDAEGIVKIKPAFLATGDFSEGKCRIKNQSGRWGFIDDEGNDVIPCQFDSAGDFYRETALIFQKGRCGLINQKGDFILQPVFTGLHPDGENCLFQKEGKWGWMDLNGAVIIPPGFDEALPFHGEELAAVKKGGKWGYSDKQGNIRIETKFDSVSPFESDLALVMVDRKSGFINQLGKYHIRPRYEAVSEDFSAHLFHRNSRFEEAESDLFDISRITSRIQCSKPEGFPLLSRFTDLINKYPVKKKSLDSLTAGGLALNEHLLVADEKISSEASLSFAVFANAYKVIPDEEKPMLIFNPDVLSSAFKYTIRLSGKGKGKEKSIMEALEKSLKGMKKNEALSDDSGHFFSSNTCMTEFKFQPGLISILITPKLAAASAPID